MPLNLALKYNGWASREVVDFFVKYCEVLFKRYKGKVHKWILVNQINLIVHESFNHLGIASDKVDNLLEAKYQGVHNEMVACAKATKIAHEIDPANEIGMMFCSNLTYHQPSPRGCVLEYAPQPDGISVRRHHGPRLLPWLRPALLR